VPQHHGNDALARLADIWSRIYFACALDKPEVGALDLQNGSGKCVERGGDELISGCRVDTFGDAWLLREQKATDETRGSVAVRV
jgi:hypothetical protein